MSETPLIEEPSMLWAAIAVVSLAVLVSAALTGLFLGRASRARRETSLRLHDAVERLDGRCDVLQEQILRLDQRQRIGHLAHLVAQGEAEGRFTEEVARSLHRFTLELDAESLASPP